MFSSGQFAELFGVSKRLLRHYNEIGLLVPADVDRSNGYSYYSRDQLDAMKRIMYLRSLQLPLPDIKELLANPPEAWSGGISRHLTSIRDQRQRLQHIETQLESIQRRIDVGEPVIP